MKLKALCALVATSVVVMGAPQAVAQSGSDGWEFTIAPYLVAAGLDGSLTVADIEADVDVAFDDVISDLEFALMGHFDMTNERWMVSSDLMSVILGYRAIDMEYEDGSGLEYFHYDLLMAGPQLGVAFRF